MPPIGTTEIVMVLFIFGIPGLAGALVARSKGRNVLGWCVASALLFVPLLVLLFLPSLKGARSDED